MKAVFSVIAGGMFAFALNAQAAPQLSPSAYSALTTSQTARSFTQEIATATGMTINSQAALQSAIGKLGAAEQAAIINKLNSFSSQVVTGAAANGTINEAAAKQAFMSNGQVLTVAALSKQVASKEAVLSNSCPANATEVLAQDANVSKARVNELLEKGVLTITGACGKDATSMSAEARRRLVVTADCAAQNGVASARDVQAADQIYSGCLAQAFSKDGLTLSAADAMARVQGLRQDCAYIGAPGIAN